MENQQPQDVMYALGHIQSSVESMGKKIDEFITESRSGHTDHDARIRKLEDGKLSFLAIVSTLGTLGGGLAAIILKVFNIG